MPSLLITGAANGLGAAFVRQYAKQKDTTIIALDRQRAAEVYDNVKNIQIDISSQETVNDLARQIEGQPIDLVVHSAGIRGLVPSRETQPSSDITACESLSAMNLETMMRTFHINTAGTFMLLRALLPNLRKAAAPKVIVLSSRMGSVGNNEHPNKDAGGAYAYRASKAALNTIVRSLAADVPDVTFVLCHPGRVETSLVRWKEEGAISPEESLESILPLIERWDSADSGRFYDRFGEAIEW